MVRPSDRCDNVAPMPGLGRSTPPAAEARSRLPMRAEKARTEAGPRCNRGQGVGRGPRRGSADCGYSRCRLLRKGIFSKSGFRDEARGRNRHRHIAESCGASGPRASTGPGVTGASWGIEASPRLRPRLNTRFGIYKIVRRHTRGRDKVAPRPSHRRISPHVFRHTTAVHWLEAGVDVNTIRGWLGHVSLDTTNRYAEINIRTKEEALKTCEPPSSASSEAFPRKPVWKDDTDLLKWLKSL